MKCATRGRFNGFRVYIIYRVRQEDCTGCRSRLKCLSRPNTLRRYLLVRVEDQKTNLIDAMKARIDTPQGKQVYGRRLTIVKPVFVKIWVQKWLKRFTLRTKARVDVQWRLFALVPNIGKINKYGLVH